MMQRKKRALLTIVLLFLILCCRSTSVLAAVEVKVHSILDLDKSPMDLVTTGDGKWAYILMPGEVQVYSLNTKSLVGRFPVDKEVRRISIPSRGDQIYLMNEKSKTLSIASLAFVDMFNVTGSPFKGPANAPVVVTVFSDYQ